jgi:hypothetical protein
VPQDRSRECGKSGPHQVLNNKSVSEAQKCLPHNNLIVVLSKDTTEMTFGNCREVSVPCIWKTDGT